MNGLEAFHICVHNKTHIVLMDLNMIQMNGFESCKLIKQHYRNEAKQLVPYIVAVSASVYDDSLLAQVKNAGFDDWFETPLTADDLQTKIIDKYLSCREEGESESIFDQAVSKSTPKINQYYQDLVPMSSFDFMILDAQTSLKSP